MMVKCKTNVRPSEIKGVEIEFIGECGELVDGIMKNMGPYTQKWFKSKMVFTDNETGVASNGVEK